MIDRDYVSPDGILRFLVRSPNGDITMGFDGFPWHTHGDVLAGATSRSTDEASEQFVAHLITGKLIIAVSAVSGQIRDVWITDDPAGDLRYCPPEETIVFRLWDGTAVQ
jgi:hypothetical protein